jgi:hypothetical protein
MPKNQHFVTLIRQKKGLNIIFKHLYILYGQMIGLILFPLTFYICAIFAEGKNVRFIHYFLLKLSRSPKNTNTAEAGFTLKILAAQL